MPNPKIAETHKVEREEYAHVLSGHIISIESISDKHQEALTFEERREWIRWLKRGRTLVSRIDPTIFNHYSEE